MTQTERLKAYLIAHPGASSLEIQNALTITNCTGRISDLRDMGEREGFDVLREKRPDTRWGYAVVPREPMTLGLTA